MDVIREHAFAGRTIDVPVIDAHTHILTYHHSGWYQAFGSLEDVTAVMDHLGINCIVTAPHNLVTGSIDDTNQAAADAARQYPGRIYGYIVVRPQIGMEQVRATIDTYARNPAFVGFKFLAGYHGPLDVPEYRYALDFAVEHRCPVLSHTWCNNPTMADIEAVVKPRPDLKLIMAHQGGGRAEFTDAYVKLMRDYPNLFMETCGSLYNRYGMEDMVELAGEDRVIFGTDMINLDPRFDFGRVVFSTLSDEVKQKLLAGNYLRLLADSQLGTISL